MTTFGGIALTIALVGGVAGAMSPAEAATPQPDPGTSWQVDADSTAKVLLGDESSPATSSQAPSNPTRATATAALHQAKALLDGTLLRRLRSSLRLAQARGQRPQTKAIDATMILRDLYLARPAMTASQRAQADAILARPTDVGGDKLFCDTTCHYVTLPAASPTVSNSHFVVHYRSGSGIGNVTDTATPAQAQLTADTMLSVYNTEVGRLGFNAPRSDAGVGSGSGNPDSRIDIYLGNLGQYGIYGYCATDPHASTTTKTSAYCVLDNNFASTKFHGAAPINSLRVTAAHEFFHAIQFGYNVRQPRWFMEGTAVWMEDEVYPSINDYYQYLTSSPILLPTLPFTYNGQYTVYGDFALYKFLQTKFHDRGFVKKMWNQVSSHPTMSAMTSLKKVLKSHHSSLHKMLPVFGLWNTLPKGSYPDRRHWLSVTHGVGVWKVGTLRLGHRSRWLSPKVKPLATAPLAVLPKGKKSRARAVITVKAPKTGGVWVQIRLKNGKTKKLHFKLNRKHRGTHTYKFKPKKTSAIVVTMTNATDHGGARRFHARVTFKK